MTIEYNFQSEVWEDVSEDGDEVQFICDMTPEGGDDILEKTFASVKEFEECFG